jgi:hypothetical protein
MVYSFHKFWLKIFFVLRRIQQDIVIDVHNFSRKVSYFLPDFNELENFQQILENSETPNFMKIRQEGAEMFQTDRQTWRS